MPSGEPLDAFRPGERFRLVPHGGGDPTPEVWIKGRDRTFCRLDCLFDGLWITYKADCMRGVRVHD